jgi:hypothetical protein
LGSIFDFLSILVLDFIGLYVREGPQLRSSPKSRLIDSCFTQGPSHDNALDLRPYQPHKMFLQPSFQYPRRIIQ